MLLRHSLRLIRTSSALCLNLIFLITWMYKNDASLRGALKASQTRANEMMSTIAIPRDHSNPQTASRKLQQTVLRAYTNLFRNSSRFVNNMPEGISGLSPRQIQIPYNSGLENGRGAVHGGRSTPLTPSVAGAQSSSLEEHDLCLLYIT
jgi:hypothetical protein